MKPRDPSRSATSLAFKQLAAKNVRLADNVELASLGAEATKTLLRHAPSDSR